MLSDATVTAEKGKVLSGVYQWALALLARSNHNKATCALANKLARICYATLRHHAAFDEKAALATKARRQSVAIPAWARASPHGQPESLPHRSEQSAGRRWLAAWR